MEKIKKKLYNTGGTRIMEIKTQIGNEKKAMHISVKGLVQGVGFRYWTLSLANDLRIKGWVRNRADRSVEIAAEADENTLHNFIRILKTGPHHARVDELTVKDIELSDYPNFTIKR